MKCKTCEGTGIVDYIDPIMSMGSDEPYIEERECGDCEGTGEIEGDDFLIDWYEKEEA